MTKKPKLWQGEVQMTVTVQVGGVPARTRNQAEELVKAVAENALSPKKRVRLWRKKSGEVEPWGKGQPTIALVYPVADYRMSEVDLVDDVEEDE